MNVYVHTGKGKYIGSTVVVIAPSKFDAMVLVKKELTKCGLGDEKVNIEKVMPADVRGVVLVNNGDY